jgi:hypothetical protein
MQSSTEKVLKLNAGAAVFATSAVTFDVEEGTSSGDVEMLKILKDIDDIIESCYHIPMKKLMAGAEVATVTAMTRLVERNRDAQVL